MGHEEQVPGDRYFVFWMDVLALRELGDSVKTMLLDFSQASEKDAHSTVVCPYPCVGSTKRYIVCFCSLHIHILYGFSLAYPNCQHHHSSALGTLLSKIRVSGTQALQNEKSLLELRIDRGRYLMSTQK